MFKKISTACFWSVRLAFALSLIVGICFLIKGEHVKMHPFCFLIIFSALTMMFWKAKCAVNSKNNISQYIQSLECLLIFMCKTHEAQRESLLKLMKDGNNAFIYVPQIQGSSHLAGISHLSSLEFTRPQFGFQDVYDIIKEKTPAKKKAEELDPEEQKSDNTTFFD